MMKKSRSIFQWTLLITLLAAGGCSVKNAEALKGPYQDALEAYYSGIETQRYDAALQKASAALKASPDDLAVRMLRAQINLMQFRALMEQGNQNSEAAGVKTRLLADLRVIDENMDKIAPETDWVAPRVYTAVGDVLLLEGNQSLGKAESSFSKKEAWQTMAFFEAAALYYAKAIKMTETAKEPTPGMRNEQGNAQDGLVQSYRGYLESIALLENAYTSSDAVFSRNFDQERLATIDRLLLLVEGKTAFVRELPEVRLPLDRVYHEEADQLFVLITTRQAMDIEGLCAGAPPDAKAVLEQQAALRKNLHRMATHRAISSMMGAEVVFVAAEMELGYNRDAQKVCP
ncbi:MAG: hypothetical protein SFV52_11685 [Saprospiraceae bacterium]|nr:hypothetical protein [Saprospiraceae bacterium]